MHIHITYVLYHITDVFHVEMLTHVSSGPDESQIARAKELTEDLLIVVRQEHQKARTAMMEQQLQLQQAQAQYAAYSAYNVRSCCLEHVTLYSSSHIFICPTITGLCTPTPFRCTSTTSPY